MTRRGPVVAAVAGVALILVAVVALILPKASAIKAKQNEVAAAEAQQAKLQLQLDQLKADQKDAKKTRRQLQTISQQMPPVADLPGLIKTLNSLTTSTGVDFLSLAPGQPTAAATGDFSVVPIQVTIVGSFFSVDQYMFQLENLPRASKVTTLALTAGPDGLPQLQAVASVEFYTSDTSAGPGSVPGSTGAAQTAPVAVPSAAPTTPAGG